MTTAHRGALVVGVTAVGSLGSYLALFAWDQHKTLGSDGYLHGPYEPWQVVCFVIILAALAVWATMAGALRTGGVVMVLAVTAAWSFDAATDVENDGLWPVGALGVLAGTTFGYVVVSALVSDVRRRRHSDHGHRDPLAPRGG